MEESCVLHDFRFLSSIANSRYIVLLERLREQYMSTTSIFVTLESFVQIHGIIVDLSHTHTPTHLH